MVTLRHLLDHSDIILQRARKVKLFFMGEPLLHPEYPEMISIARKHLAG